MTLDYNVTGGFKSKKSYHLYFQNLRPKNFTIQDIIQKYLKKKIPIRSKELAPMAIIYNYNTKPRKSVAEHLDT